MEEKLVLVMLRRPDRSNSKEKRSDPFWECGSFGCTGCYERNLMNPRTADRVKGLRLAFVQGGNDGFKLVYVTPPIRVRPDRIRRRRNGIVKAYDVVEAYLQ